MTVLLFKWTYGIKVNKQNTSYFSDVFFMKL